MSRSMVVIFCLLVAIIAAGGILDWLPDQSDRSIRSSRIGQPTATAAASPKARDGQWLTTTLARPLFSPDRKPPPGVIVADRTLPRLTGIIVATHEPVAIFKSDESGKSTIVHRGDSIAGWRVAEIEREAVYLEKLGERVVVMPKFAAQLAAGQQPTQMRR